ncbi:MAG: hypothetical protein WCH83_14275, partial [Alphaproteobacteria bacterium]
MVFRLKAIRLLRQPGAETDRALPMRVIIDADLILEGFDGQGSPLLHEASGLVVDSGKVVAIAPSADLQRTEPATPRLGGAGVVITPGFINAHHHVG